MVFIPQMVAVVIAETDSLLRGSVSMYRCMKGRDKK
jgi:hypothetical protein